VGLALCLAAIPVSATTYGSNSNPACREMRNTIIAAPFPAEPNREDARVAMGLAGDAMLPTDRLPILQRYDAHALPLLLKIDREDTTALTQLPPSLPRIDFVIDRHLTNLTWARAMLGVFYEEGRATPVDYARAASFYQRSIDTKFLDERGCVHSWPPYHKALTHLGGLYAYGLGVPEDHAKARQLLQMAGRRAESAIYLLDHDALPATFRLYLNSDLDMLAAMAKNPHPNATSLILNLDRLPNSPLPNVEAGIRTVVRIGEWVACVVAALFFGLVIVRARRREGDGQMHSLLGAVYETYRSFAKVISRLGLVVGGLVGCVTGLWIMAFAFAMGMMPWQVDLFSLDGFASLALNVAGLGAFFGGLAKIGESARVRQGPTNAQVHGDARPAGEEEAKKAARGVMVGPNLNAREFRD
jgi:hypothetical protein